LHAENATGEVLRALHKLLRDLRICACVQKRLEYSLLTPFAGDLDSLVQPQAPLSVEGV